MEYTIVQWFLFFYIYCFFGWCFESTYVSIRKRHLVNRGFMRGPYLPLYGFGASLLLAVSIPVSYSVMLVFFIGMTVATALEYVTGVIMEAIFKVRYWDYSNQKFNFQGHICLSSSVAWGMLNILLIRYLNRPVSGIVVQLDKKIELGAAIFVGLIMVFDLVISTYAALGLRRLLLSMTKAKEELEKLQLRINNLFGSANERVDIIKEGISSKLDVVNEKVDIIKDEINCKLERINSYFKVHAQKDIDSEELNQISERMNILIDKREELAKKFDFLKRSLVRSNPSASSKKFSRAFNELKNIVNERYKKR